MSSELANLNSFWYYYKSFYYQKPCLLTKKITEIVPATEYESQQECNMKSRLVINGIVCAKADDRLYKSTHFHFIK